MLASGLAAAESTQEQGERVMRTLSQAAIEIARLRTALQNIANLPIVDNAKIIWRRNPRVRAWRIALAALGASPKTVKNAGAQRGG